jgi:hypothetical protein
MLFARLGFRLIFPVAVKEKRFFAALFVFIFGMAFSPTRCDYDRNSINCSTTWLNI